jgi:hypothetical protein
MRLVDYVASHCTLAAGETLWLTLRWTKLLDTGQDYSVGLSLVDGNGHAIARVDKPLLSNKSYQTTSHWAIGETSTDYYSLPIPAHTPLSDYRLRVVIYNTAGERLAPINAQVDLALPLAEITVTPAALPVDVTTLSIGTAVALPFTADLRVIGLDCPATVHPGEQIDVDFGRPFA